MLSDTRAWHCDHPSLLMSLLPGRVRVGDEGAGERAGLLARPLLRVHRVEVTARTRPRTCQAWTAPERVRPPEATWRPELWRRAVHVIRREPPTAGGRGTRRTARSSGRNSRCSGRAAGDDGGPVGLR